MKNEQRKLIVQDLLNQLAEQVLGYINDNEQPGTRWVAAARIKRELGLNLVSFVQSNKTQCDTPWFFNTIVRLLEDRNLVEHMKEANKSYFRRKLFQEEMV